MALALGKPPSLDCTRAGGIKARGDHMETQEAREGGRNPQFVPVQLTLTGRSQGQLEFHVNYIVSSWGGGAASILPQPPLTSFLQGSITSMQGHMED